jgi:hypothetical protein
MGAALRIRAEPCVGSAFTHRALMRVHRVRMRTSGGTCVRDGHASACLHRYACIKESIRLHPPLIFLMRRVMTELTTAGARSALVYSPVITGTYQCSILSAAGR